MLDEGHIKDNRRNQAVFSDFDTLYLDLDYQVVPDSQIQILLIVTFLLCSPSVLIYLHDEQHGQVVHEVE